jgi:hypothetical protein
MLRPGSDVEITWKGVLAPVSGDARIDAERIEGKEKEAGSLLLLGGKALAVRGLELSPGDEIDALDAPILYLQMVTGALAAALPAGPDAIKKRTGIDHRETRAPLQASTMSGGGSIPPPWTVKGHVEPAAGGGLAFDVELAGGPPRSQERFVSRFSGLLADPPPGPPFDESMSLQGWTLYSLGGRSIQQGGATRLDYGASKREARYETVAQVRAALRTEEEIPGNPDPALDLTGFWKRRCEESFGLRIQRSAPDAPYFITFRGPRGGDEAEPGATGRSSYIKGDPRFQIVSPDEIQEREAAGWTTYHRCRTRAP